MADPGGTAITQGTKSPMTANDGSCASSPKPDDCSQPEAACRAMMPTCRSWPVSAIDQDQAAVINEVRTGQYIGL